MNLPAFRPALLSGLCVLPGCVLIFPGDHWPGPHVSHEFATDVEAEVRLTDGTTHRETYGPCINHSFYDILPFGRVRTVFVERLTFWKDGERIGEYEGATVEALGAIGGRALLDESGLRRDTGNRQCSRVFNTLDRDIRVSTRYADGSTASLTLRPCKPHLWLGNDPLRDERARREEIAPTRLTVAHDGRVIHDLDERAIRKTFKRHLRSGWAMIYAISNSDIAGVEGSTPPKVCLQHDVGRKPASSRRHQSPGEVSAPTDGESGAAA